MTKHSRFLATSTGIAAAILAASAAPAQAETLRDALVAVYNSNPTAGLIRDRIARTDCLRDIMDRRPHQIAGLIV